MTLFLTILYKIIPLYAYVFLGIIAKLYFKVEQKSIVAITLNVIGPIVIFLMVLNLKLSFIKIFLPILIFVLCCLVAIITYYTIGYFFKNNKERNLIASASGHGNYLFLGIPIAFLSFSESTYSLYVIACLGAVFFQITYSYYLMARGDFDLKKSLKKVLFFPLVLGAIAGLIFNVLNIDVSGFSNNYGDVFRNSFSLLGMMIIGMAFINDKKTAESFDFKFTMGALFGRYFIFSLVSMCFILCDYFLFKFFDFEIYKIIILLSILPIGSFLVTFASELNIYPQKASNLVLITTIISLFLIPFVFWCFEVLI